MPLNDRHTVRDPMRTEGKPMTEDDILAAVRTKLKTSMGYHDDTLTSNWESAYDYYKGEAPAPNDAQNSTAVSTDVSDTIEWVLPAILKPLIESPEAIRFDPKSPEDEDQAALESDYVHYKFMKECDGFVKLYCHIKDALLLKNSVFCTYWDEGYTSQREPYRDLTAAALADLLHPSDGSEVKLLEASEREEPLIDVMTGQPLPPAPPAAPGGPPPAPTTETLYDVVVRRYRTRGAPVVENCRPEGFKVDFSHNTVLLRDASWCAYSFVKTRAELEALGYDEEKIDQIPPGLTWEWENEVRHAREDVERESNDQNFGENDTPDPSRDMFEISRMYMRLDVDGDGLAEEYLMIVGGAHAEVLLDWYEVPENPFSASTPFIAAHKFYGYSLYDKLRTVTDHKTKVLRMLEDHIDLTNNPYKKGVIGEFILDDLLVRQVGGVWRVNDQNSISEVPVQPLAPQAAQLLEFYDKQRSERSGVDPNAQSIGALPEESMNHAVERVLSMKEELVSMLIRTFAETGIKDMFLKLRGVLMRNLDRDEVVQLRNKWVTLNPGTWVERTSNTIQVGLGTGDKMRRTMGLQAILELQMRILETGLQGLLVTPERMAWTISELIRVQGLGDPDDFVIDPSYLQKDPRNMRTPRGQEMLRAIRMQEQQRKQAQELEQQKLAIQQQEKQELYSLQLKIAEMQAQAKRYDSDSDRTADMHDSDSDLQAEVLKIRADMERFAEEMRLEWAKLGQKSLADGVAAETEQDRIKQAAKASEAKSDNE